MKRKIALILVSIMCLSTVSGCSLFRKSAIDINSLKSEDIFTNISEESNVEASEVSNSFSGAIEKIQSEENIAIKIENNITMGTEGQEDYQASISKSDIKLAKNGDVSLGEVEIENEFKASNGELAEKSKINGFFDGSSLYFVTNEGDKVKEEMSYEDFMGVINTYSLTMYENCISKAALVENKGEKTYYVTYDPKQFETTMSTNMEASGQVLADGEAMHINYANIVAKLDSENNLLAYGFVINANYEIDGNATPYTYDINVSFEDRGNVKIENSINPDEYMTADEYNKLIMERYQENSGSANETETIEESSVESSTN